MHSAVQKVYMHLMLRFLPIGDAWDHLGCIVQHNNEPQHSSRVIKDYHQAEKNKQPWNRWRGPHKAPDLSIVESFWDCRKRKFGCYCQLVWKRENFPSNRECVYII